MNERLIIKNWGPIKDVDFEIKKLTVLIGEQGTGKSIIAKLLYVISSTEFLLNQEKERENIIDSYGLFFRKNTIIFYFTKDYEVIREKGKFSVKFIGEEQEYFNDIFRSKNKLSNEDFDAFKSWFIFKNKIDNKIGEYKYVPAERVALASTLRSIRETVNRSVYKGNFDQYILDFANHYDKASEKITDFDIPHLRNVNFKRESGIEKVNFNGDSLFLYQTSSGFQVSIPMVIFLEYYSKQKNQVNKFIIEEPELNLFPEAQFEIIKYFIEKVNLGNNKLLLTTHSPYVLTSLNNLIESYKIGKIKGKSTKISKIIPKKYWLNNKDVSAYQLLPNGKYENIFIDDASIMAEKIDSVSNVINNQYDTIMEAKYGK